MKLKRDKHQRQSDVTPLCTERQHDQVMLWVAIIPARRTAEDAIGIEFAGEEI